MQPLAYIILVNWHGWRDTIECLRSLQGLDYPNYRVLVVENGSTDNSLVHIREAYPDIALIETGKNLGFAQGNNLGIRYALKQGADYVWLLNNDTIVDAGALTAMVHTAERDTSIGAVGSVLYEMHEKDSIQTYGGGWVSLWMGISRNFASPVPDDKLHYVTGASLLIRKEVVEKVGLLDDNYFMYWEDGDYGFRVRKAGWRLAVAPESKVWHKESASLAKRGVVLDRYFNASAVRFFKKNSVLLMPIFIGVGGRFSKRVARRDWKRAKAVWDGALAGWRSP